MATCSHDRVAVGRAFMGYEKSDPERTLRPAHEAVCLECGAHWNSFVSEAAVPGGWSPTEPTPRGDTVYQRNPAEESPDDAA